MDNEKGFVKVISRKEAKEWFFKGCEYGENFVQTISEAESKFEECYKQYLNDIVGGRIAK